MNCKYCPWPQEDDDPPICVAVHKSGLACTREEGHPGQHVACGLVAHEVIRWNKTNEEDER